MTIEQFRSLRETLGVGLDTLAGKIRASGGKCSKQYLWQIERRDPASIFPPNLEATTKAALRQVAEEQLRTGTQVIQTLAEVG